MKVSKGLKKLAKPVLTFSGGNIVNRSTGEIVGKINKDFFKDKLPFLPAGRFAAEPVERVQKLGAWKDVERQNLSKKFKGAAHPFSKQNTLKEIEREKERRKKVSKFPKKPKPKPVSSFKKYVPWTKPIQEREDLPLPKVKVYDLASRFKSNYSKGLAVARILKNPAFKAGSRFADLSQGTGDLILKGASKGAFKMIRSIRWF